MRSVGQDALVVAFTLYLHALGWTGTAIGAVLGALPFGPLLTIVVGPLSDRGGRRMFLLGYDLAQMLAAVIATGTATPWPLVLAAVLGGFGQGANGSAGSFAPVEQAWLAFELPMQQHGRVFSANGAVDSIDMGLGTPLRALPAWGFGHAMNVADFRLPFVLPLVGSLASFALAWLAREPAPTASDTTARVSGDPLRNTENRLHAKLVLANLLNGLGTGLAGPLIAYWFAITFERRLADIGPGMTLTFLFSALGAFAAGAIARRRGIMNTVLWMRGRTSCCWWRYRWCRGSGWR